LEAYAEALSLLRPYFPQGWAALPDSAGEWAGSYLANSAGFALNWTGEPAKSLAAFGAALAAALRASNWEEVGFGLRNIGSTFARWNSRALEDRCSRYGLKAAILTADQEQIFKARLDLFAYLAVVGQWAEAAALWNLIEPMGRDWSRAGYRPGYAEFWFAQYRFWRGDLEEKHLAGAEQLTRTGKNREGIRRLHALRGEWLLERGEWARACESFREAVSMARAVGQIDAIAETQMALAQFRLGQLNQPRHIAEQLANAANVSHRALADLWLAIGEREQAEKHALAAYKWAWADGEPYVRRYDLDKARAILETLGAEIPNLPPFDPSKIEKFPYEDEVAAAIEKLQAEKDAEVEGLNPPAPRPPASDSPPPQ
jgi:hypothetical protein